MIAAVIIEDEKPSMEYLVSMLKKNHPNIYIKGWASDVDEAVTLIKDEKPAIVFLDIELNDGNGFEVLDSLQHEMTFDVIFTTGFVDYKEKAMDYFAFYYLNKPVQPAEMKKVLNMYELKRKAFDFRKYEAFKHQIEEKNQIITVFIKGEYIHVRLMEILYLEASGNYTTLRCTDNRSFIISKNLKKIEKIIENNDFVRVHRSFLVNIQHVEKHAVGRTLHMSDGTEIPVSVRNHKTLLSILITKKL